jgi:hypothetical protein
MNGEYVRIWKETAVSYFKLQSWRVLEGTGENRDIGASVM